MTNGNMKGRCKYSLGVLCDNLECEVRCGWNPAEMLRRHTQLKRDGLSNFGNEIYGLPLNRVNNGEELAGKGA